MASESEWEIDIEDSLLANLFIPEIPLSNVVTSKSNDTQSHPDLPTREGSIRYETRQTRQVKKIKYKSEGFDTSDDEPLMKTTRWNDSDLEPLATLLDSDLSEGSEYRPDISETSMSDPISSDENENIRMSKSQRKKRKHKISTPNKSKSLEYVIKTRKKRFGTTRRPKQNCNADIEKAIMISRDEARKKNAVVKAHSKKMDALLRSNGQILAKVPGDGNCFFHAAGIIVDQPADQLKEQVIEHLIAEQDEYKN
ncbi:unnamed protein product, partial [Owenia fusiformis]